MGFVDRFGRVVLLVVMCLLLKCLKGIRRSIIEIEVFDVYYFFLFVFRMVFLSGYNESFLDSVIVIIKLLRKY